MRFMILVKASKDSEAGKMPSQELLAAMHRHRRPVRRDQRADRPVLAGQVKSKSEAIEWVKRCPNPMPGSEAEIEIRQGFEAEDFGKR